MSGATAAAIERDNHGAGQRTSDPLRQRRVEGWSARRLAGRGVRSLAGLVLLLAAGLKAAAMATDPDGASRAGTFALVAWEWGLGVWLLSGLWPRLAWGVAVVTLLAFASASGLSWSRGEASCGCFGQFAVPPPVSLAGNLVLLAALLITRPPRSRHRAYFRSRLGGAMVAVALPLGAAAALALEPALGELRPDGTIAGDSRAVAVDPHEWPGDRLPLLNHIDVGDELARDAWRVLFYRPDCPSCRDTLDRLAAGPSGVERTAADDSAPLAVVLLGGGEGVPEEIPEGVLVGRLDPSRTWQVPPSTVVDLRAGVVIAVMPEAPTPPAAEAEEEGEASPATAAAPGADGSASVADAVGHRRPDEPTLFVADLGFVEEDSRHEIRYEVRSPSGKPLQIRGTEIECSCTTPVDLPGAVAARSVTPVRVAFEAPGEATSYSKNLILLTDDPAHPRLTLRLEARVGLPLLVEQMAAEVGMEAGDGTVHLSVRNDSSRPVRLVYATVDNPAYEVQLPEAAVAGGSHGVVRVRQIADDPTGRHSSAGGLVRVRVATDHPAQPSLLVEIELGPAEAAS